MSLPTTRSSTFSQRRTLAVIFTCRLLPAFLGHSDLENKQDEETAGLLQQPAIARLSMILLLKIHHSQQHRSSSNRVQHNSQLIESHEEFGLRQHPVHRQFLFSFLHIFFIPFQRKYSLNRRKSFFLARIHAHYHPKLRILL